MPLTHAVSRRRFNETILSGNWEANLSALLGRTVSELGAADTVNYLMSKMDTGGLESTLPALAKRLIRSKCLDRFRLDGDIMIAIDATELMRQEGRRHCEHCLMAKHKDGRVEYFHRALEAKLVTFSGLTVSLGFEFIGNVDGEYVKQDCELKSFRRLAPRLKKLFPHLRICILGDGLYACDPVMELLESMGWHYFLSFPPERIPTLAAEAEARLAASPSNALRAHNAVNECPGTYRWTDTIKYRSHFVRTVNADFQPEGEKAFTLGYLTDSRIDKSNVQELVNQGGRQRAQIENSFNTQKNHGYKLDHPYGAQGHALKNYYAVIQIAHLIHQLMLRTDLLGKLSGAQNPLLKCAWTVYRTIHGFVRELADALRYGVISGVDRLKELSKSIQIRFTHNTS